MSLMKKSFLTLCILFSPTVFATTVYFHVHNSMQDEFLVARDNITDNVKSHLPGPYKIIYPTKTETWSIEVPNKTLQEIYLNADFLYEIIFSSTTFLANAEHAPTLGLSQYPTMRNSPFHLYHIESATESTLFDEKHPNIVLEQNIKIDVSRFQSFIGY